METINLQDVIDVRNIIERVEELREARNEYDEHHGTPGAWAEIDDGEPEELAALEALLEDLEGNGGDEQWEGSWYPVTLIRDSHFTDYAQELLEECGDLPANLPHYIEIDWEATASNIRTDYTSTEIDGVTYWYR